MFKETHTWDLEKVINHRSLKPLKKQCGGNQEKFEDYAEAFYKVHLKHYYAWGLEARKDYTLGKIKKVVWNTEERCFHVHFQKDWFHYCPYKKVWW